MGDQPPHITAPSLRAMKKDGKKIVCLTAYDLTSAQIADAAGVDVILVGDSVGNVVQGHDTTLPVTLEQMAYHTSMVARAKPRALLVADLPFGSYQVSTQQAIESAITLAKAGAAAVKLEGPYLEAVEGIIRAGIPVMGHVGMTPQSVHRFGGFRVQGRGEEGNQIVIAAQKLDAAGAFAIVLELVPSDAGMRVTKTIQSPTIGIGAGPYCDGQVQVFHDLLGLQEQSFKHVKRYVEGRTLFTDAIKAYGDDVRSGKFPATEHSF